LKIKTKKILIIDEDYNACQILKARLSNLGYIVFLLDKKDDPIVIFDKKTPDLVILEICLSTVDGYVICSKLRQRSKTPIIILTILSNISDRILGFNLGADDYLLKPFSLRELEARINVKLSSIKNIPTLIPFNPTLKVNNLDVNVYEKKVFKQNVCIKLTLIEFHLLEFLIMQSGKVLSRTFILNNVWGYTPERHVDMRIVDVYISRLRAKLEENPTNPDFILTVRGIGYTFKYLN